MSSAQQGIESGSNEVGHIRVNKTDKIRRSWSSKEEETLLASLKELVAQGWKSDNGFGVGYLNKLEDYMQKEFPGTNLKGMPHINLKTSAWKKNYYSLSAMLTRSGVGFNLKGTHMIDCNNEQWEQIIKCDGNARLMRYKSWLMLDDWKEVFGKDRATGENAKDVMDGVNEMVHDDNIAQSTTYGAYHVNIKDVHECDRAEDSACQSQKRDAVNRGSSKKQKAGDGLGGVHELLGEISRNTNVRLERLAERIGYEFDLGKARKEVLEQLSNIRGLDDKFDVCEILADKVERLEIFMDLPEDAKPHYMMCILQSKGN